MFARDDDECSSAGTRTIEWEGLGLAEELESLYRGSAGSVADFYAFFCWENQDGTLSLLHQRGNNLDRYGVPLTSCGCFMHAVPGSEIAFAARILQGGAALAAAEEGGAGMCLDCLRHQTRHNNSVSKRKRETLTAEQARWRSHANVASHIKLLPADVIEIHGLLKADVSGVEIARRKGISTVEVSHIKAGRSWPKLHPDYEAPR